MEQQDHGRLISQATLNYKIKAPRLKEKKKNLTKTNQPFSNVSEIPSQRERKKKIKKNRIKYTRFYFLMYVF